MSAKTVAEKLVIEPDSTLWLSHPSRLALIGPLPDRVYLSDAPGRATVSLFFSDYSISLRGVLDTNRHGVDRPGTVWVAYPNANRIDLNSDGLWPNLTEYGPRPNGQVAVDESRRRCDYDR